MQSPTHTAKPNTANHLAVQCRTEGDVKYGGMLKLKISGRRQTDGLKTASFRQEGPEGMVYGKPW